MGGHEELALACGGYKSMRRATLCGWVCWVGMVKLTEVYSQSISRYTRKERLRNIAVWNDFL